MDSGTRTGIYFGTTSGVITTLGVIIGLNAGTESLVAVVGGILVIVAVMGILVFLVAETLPLFRGGDLKGEAA